MKPGVTSQEALYKEVGQLISDARRAIGVTQRELALRLGRSRTFVTNLEAGVNPVSLHIVFEVATILGRPAESLLPHAPTTLSNAGLPTKYRRMVQDVRKDG
jgi:transcriptional regulator with XRE-family HTH domain